MDYFILFLMFGRVPAALQLNVNYCFFSCPSPRGRVMRGYRSPRAVVQRYLPKLLLEETPSLQLGPATTPHGKIN